MYVKWDIYVYIYMNTNIYTYEYEKGLIRKQKIRETIKIGYSIST